MTTLSKLFKPLATAAALCGLSVAASAQVLPWNQLFPTASPSSRERAPLATDGNVVYAYGGQVSTTTAPYDELWSFDGATWTLVTASGAGAGARAGGGMVWDSSRNKLVVFSGKGVGGVWANYDNQTWEWDTTNGWVQMAPTSSPDGRWLFDLVFVPGVGAVLHGGLAVDATGATYTSSETWAWDGINWTLLTSAGPALKNGKMVFRSATNDLVYFGGEGLTPGKLPDTWIYDIATSTWAQQVTATLPTSDNATGGPGLIGPGMFADPVTGKIILHGGQGNGGPPSTLTWEFDGLDWADVTPATSPQRRNHDIVWVPSLSRGITALGSSGSATNQTWERGVTTLGSFTVKGTDCATSAGLTASISSPAMPAINTNLVVEFGNLTPGTLTLAAVGGSDSSLFGIPLPLPMAVIFPGSGASCSLQVSNDIGLYTPALDVSGTSATLTLPVPNDPTFVGLTAFVQGIQVELIAGITAANTAYGEIVIGQL